MYMLRQALTTGSEPRDSYSEDAVNPLPEKSPRCFEHCQVVIGTDGTHIELGRSAMGITFKAFEMVLGVEVASESYRRSYRGPTLKRGNVPCAKHARLLGFGTRTLPRLFTRGKRKSDGQCFYAMELVEGETLEARLRRGGPLTPALALEVITQVARALVAIEMH
jgi:serine/threonine protein kinase